MPRIVRFSASEIAMYFADHPPPHFHVLGREGAAQVTIETLEIIAIGRRVGVREALAGATDNKALLRARWAILSEGA